MLEKLIPFSGLKTWEITGREKKDVGGEEHDFRPTAGKTNLEFLFFLITKSEIPVEYILNSTTALLHPPLTIHPMEP